MDGCFATQGLPGSSSHNRITPKDREFLFFVFSFFSFFSIKMPTGDNSVKRYNHIAIKHWLPIEAEIKIAF